jgi:hypothetical protein
MRRQLRLACLAACVVTIVGCGSNPHPPVTSDTSSPPPLAPSDPTCPKVPVHIVLHFDSRHLWGTDLDHNTTLLVALRSDTRWIFKPGPPSELVDSTGQTTAHDGDIFYEACRDAASNTYVIGPEDLPNPSPGA